MKNRFLILLAVLLCLICALVLVSCDEGDTPEGETPPAVCQHRDADDNSLCDKCGESYTDGVDVTTPGHTHSWGEWVEMVSPTCVARGTDMRICSCGKDEMRYVDVDPADSRLFRPFREGLARALGCDRVDGNRKVAHELRRAGRDRAGCAVAGESALGEKDEAVALADCADHIEHGASVGAEHFLRYRVHYFKYRAQKLAREEVLAHNEGHAARIERHRGQEVILV